MYIFAAIIYRHYQYGQSQGDVNVRNDLYCDASGKTCASDFIQIPNIQISNGQYKRLKASECSWSS